MKSLEKYIYGSRRGEMKTNIVVADAVEL